MIKAEYLEEQIKSLRQQEEQAFAGLHEARGARLMCEHVLALLTQPETAPGEGGVDSAPPDLVVEEGTTDGA